MSDTPHIRLGDLWLRLAEGFHDVFGQYGLERVWDSLFADRTATSGDPGVENLRSEDLAWRLTSFGGGEGQRVFDASDARSKTRYESSQGVDLENPGQIQLARALGQQGLTGDPGTTIEGSVFDPGTDIVGTDQGMPDVGDQLTHDLVLPAGNHQVDFYAYISGPFVIAPTNDVWQREGPNDDIVFGADYIRMKNAGNAIRTQDQRDPSDGRVELTAYIRGDLGTKQKGTCKVSLIVRNADDTATVAVNSRTLDSSKGDYDDARKLKVAFTARAGKTYLYRLKIDSDTAGGARLIEPGIEQRKLEGYVFKWEVRLAGVTIQQGTRDLAGVEASQRVAATTISTTGATFTIRVTRQSGPDRRMYLDKIVHHQVTLRTPYNLELGKGGRFWLIDYDAGSAPAALWWDQQNQQWQAVANLSAAVGGAAPAGARCLAMAHSDAFEYVLLDDGCVYRVNTPNVAQRYTAAITGAVGMAICADRLYVLSETSAAGANLWEFPVDADLADLPIAVPDFPVFPVSTRGVTPDTSIVQRVAPTPSGPVFFVNHGPTCYVYLYDAGAQAGQALVEIPPGFRAQAIVHSYGFSYLGGSFPATDDDGLDRLRPAIFSIDHAFGVPPAQQLDVRLWRDADASTGLQAMQLYGRSLHVLTDLGGDSPALRAWRIDLGSEGVFLEHEIPLDDSQFAGAARAIAVNWRTRIAVWSAGNPYYERIGIFKSSGESTLRSSRYQFGLTEEKILLSVELDAVIPDGCAVEIRYIADDGDAVSAGVFTAPGSQLVSQPDDTHTFNTLQLEVVLYTTDETLTPVVYAFGARGTVSEHRKTWTVLIQCADGIATYHEGDQQVKGYVIESYLFDLAGDRSVVEFEDRYSSEEASDAQVYAVQVLNPRSAKIRRGESIIFATLMER